MTERLEFLDLSPSAHPLSAEDKSWLLRVQEEVDVTPLVVRLGAGREEIDPIVSGRALKSVRDAQDDDDENDDEQ